VWHFCCCPFQAVSITATDGKEQSVDHSFILLRRDDPEKNVTPDKEAVPTTALPTPTAAVLDSVTDSAQALNRSVDAASLRYMSGVYVQECGFRQAFSPPLQKQFSSTASKAK
jgi:hypothetical protein